MFPIHLRVRHVYFVFCFVLLFGSIFSVISANTAGKNLDASDGSATDIAGNVCLERISSLRHSLAKLPNGMLFMIFKSEVVEAGAIDAVYVCKSNNNGVTWSSPTRVSTSQYCGQGYAIASDLNNNVYAAWVGTEGVSSPWNIYIAKFNGVSWSSPVGLYTGFEPALYIISLDMCIDSNSNVHVVWDTSRAGNSTHEYMRNQIYYAKFNGATWSAPVLISAHPSNTPYFQLNPCIAVDSKNNLHVVWEGSAYPSTKGQVWYVKNDGQWNNPMLLVESVIPNMYAMYLQNVALDVDSNDVLHIVWQAPADMNTRTDQIWYMSYGASLSTPRVISNTPLSGTSDQTWPAITVDSSNRVHVLWMSSREGTMYYSRYDPAQSWSTPVQVEDANAAYPNFAESPYYSRETAELGYVFSRGSSIFFNTVNVNSIPAGPNFSVYISPISENVGVGQALRFTCAIKAGTSPYSYQWRVNGTDVQGANADSWVFEGSTAGTYLVSVAITDAASNTVYSQAAKVKVTNDYVKGYFGCIENGNQGKGENAYYAFGSKYTLNVEANITSMSAYLSAWKGQQYPTTYSCRFAIYTDSGGSVGRLISQTKIASYNATGFARLCKADFDAPVSLSPGTYWLMGVMDASAGGTASSIQTNDYNQSVGFNIGGMDFLNAGAGTPYYGSIYSIYASWELNRPTNLQEVFSVSSNSTISSLIFDAEKNQISFTVTGPSGTVGYADFYISKSMLNDPKLLTVLLDGTQLNFTTISQDETWILHFIYSHSTHEVTLNMVNGDQNLPTPSAVSVIDEFMELNILCLITAVLTIALLGLVVIHRKRKGAC
jgi:hypothetical protein